MSYLYRCCLNYLDGPNKGKPCRQRHSFKRKVEDYSIKKRCKGCGNLITFMDTWQMKHNKKATCNCDGIDYPHRKGTSVWCSEHINGPTDLDYEERYGK